MRIKPAINELPPDQGPNGRRNYAYSTNFQQYSGNQKESGNRRGDLSSYRTLDQPQQQQHQQQSSNPSKRHRERLNCELEAVANLLPYDPTVISRLDKLSVLRLAVSYLRTKALFQTFLQSILPYNEMAPCSTSTPMVNNTYYLTTGGQMLTNQHFQSQHPIFVAIDDGQRISYLLGTNEEDSNLKALGGFIMVISRDGEIIYCTPNIEMYLGFHQSDILHQPIFEMVHSEDREEVKRLLHGNVSEGHRSRLQGFFNTDQSTDERQISARFRCFLDNTCGFLRIHIKGKFLSTEPCQFSPYYWAMYGFTGGSVVAVMCTPYVLPMYAECPNGDQFLRSKHGLDLRISSMDSNMSAVLEHNSAESSRDGAAASSASHASFYSFVYPPDLPLVGEAHRQVIKQGISGILVYRVISALTEKCYWLQSSCRLHNKNGKSESIICSHRILTECEGLALLDEKRTLHVRIPTWPASHRSQSDPTSSDQATYLSPTPCAGDHLTEASVVYQNLDERYFLTDRSQYAQTLPNLDSSDFCANSTKIEHYCEMAADFSDEAQCCHNSNAIFKIPYDYSYNRTISIL